MSGRIPEEMLSAYLDGECTDAERAAVEAELASSSELRVAFDEVRGVRDALRALPWRNGSSEFWERLLRPDSEDEPAEERAWSPARAGVVALEPRRRDSRAVRWLVAASGAAAAAVIAAIVLVPQPEQVSPPVATFADAHAVRSSLQDDAVSALAPLAIQAGFRR